MNKQLMTWQEKKQLKNQSQWLILLAVITPIAMLIIGKADYIFNK